MPTNYTALTNGQFATAAVFNAPLTELDNAIQAIVGGTKTLTTPTISSFANATHTHQNAAGGGTLDAAALASGTLDNARINWAAPSAIGGTTPAAGTFNALTVKTTSSAADFIIQSDAGQFRNLLFRSGTSRRWRLYINNSSESGANAGGDFGIARYDDSDTLLGTSLSFIRATGNATFEAAISITGDIDHNGSNVGLYGAAPVARYNTTGTSTGFAAGAGTTVTHLSTFTGNTGATAYTIGDIVRALKLIGAITS